MLACSRPFPPFLSLLSCCHDIGKSAVIFYCTQMPWLAEDSGLIGTFDFGLQSLKPSTKMFYLLVLFWWVYMYILFIRVCVCVHIFICLQKSKVDGVFLDCSTVHLGRQGMPLNPKLGDLANLPGQPVPGISCLCLSDAGLKEAITLPSFSGGFCCPKL